MFLGMACLLTQGDVPMRAQRGGERPYTHAFLVSWPLVFLSRVVSLLLIFIKKVVSKDVGLILQLRTGPSAHGVISGAGIPVSWSHAISRAAAFR